MRSETQEYDLAGQVIGCAMAVHRELGHGFNEKVYKTALTIELNEQGFTTAVEKQINVSYKGHHVGEYFADILVNSSLILELKAVQTLSTAHEAQLVNYLTATNIEEGLLLNFGTTSLQFKKKFKTFKESTPPKLQP